MNQKVEGSQEKWLPLDGRAMKINLDTAMYTTKWMASLGVVACNSSVDTIFSICKVIPVCFDVQVAKLQAVCMVYSLPHILHLVILFMSRTLC